LQVALQIAEQLRQSGQWEFVAQYYRWAGAAFVERREPHNALAIYTLLSQLLPHCLHTHAMMAEQYRALGDIPTASAIYERIAHTHQAAGRLPEAAQVHRIVVDLDPTDVPRRIALAEACVALGYTDEAFKHFETAAAQLRSSGRSGEFLWTAQRLLTLCPTDKPTLRHLAEVQLQMGDTYGSVQTLRQLMAVSPKDDFGRELMAHAFAVQGQIELACRCAVLLAEELKERGYSSLPAARRILGYATTWNPHDPNVARVLHAVERALDGRARSRRGAHVRGEIRALSDDSYRADARPPGVPEMIPRHGRPEAEDEGEDEEHFDDEDTNVLPLRKRRRTVPYQDAEGRILRLRPRAS
jgi:tetratricopeptide (TPR) repeat protein